MKTLRIHCRNCGGTGRINHPEKMFCPFCNGGGNKDIKYGDDSVSKGCKKPYHMVCGEDFICDKCKEDALCEPKENKQ